MINTYRRIKQQRVAEGNDEGFTLIELLIVIVVLGILAAVVVFSLGNVTAQSAVSACSADGASLQVAQAAYNAQKGSAATSIGALVPLYVASAPSNLPHYAFNITSGGVLQVSIAPAGIVTGTGVFAAYNGPGSCTGVQ